MLDVTPNHIKIVLIYLLIIIFAACSGDTGNVGAKGDAGPPGPSGVQIASVVVDPPVIRPGETTSLNVSAADGVQSSLSYAWKADEGDLSATDTNPVQWTAPGQIGSYLVRVDVTNAAGLTATGFASVLVSVSPQGPVVTGVVPGMPRAGESITISGIGFGDDQGNSRVSIGSTEVSGVNRWSDTEISAVMPDKACHQQLVVNVGGVASSPGYVSSLWSNGEVSPVLQNDAIERRNPRVISDTQGGALLVWLSDEGGATGVDIHAQRLDCQGNRLWGDNGMVISDATSNPIQLRLIGDGQGGAFITWIQYTGNEDTEVYGQHINANGQILWAQNGIRLAGAPGIDSISNLLPVADGAGGLVLNWEFIDQLSELTVSSLISQRFNAEGTALWAQGGVSITNRMVIGVEYAMVKDSNGGFVYAWRNENDGETIDVRRLDGDGQESWIRSLFDADQSNGPTLLADDNGGVFVAWDYSTGTVPLQDIRGERYDAEGNSLWIANGTGDITGDPMFSNQRRPQLISDDHDGVIVMWRDDRNESTMAYLQRLNGAGERQWDMNGVVVHERPPVSQSVIVPNGQGGVCVVWSNLNLQQNYSQQFNFHGRKLWNDNAVALGRMFFNGPDVIADDRGGFIIVGGRVINDVPAIFARGVAADGVVSP